MITRCCTFQKLGLITALVLFFSHANANAKEVLSGFNLKSCNQKLCFNIQTPESSKATWASLYYLNSPSLTVLDPESKEPKLKIQSQSGYYDYMAQRIVLKEIQNKNFHELVIDLKSNNFRTF